MDLAKHIKPLAGESDWPIWKRKMRDMLDYHEGALEVIDNTLTKPRPLGEGAAQEHKRKCDFYRKANSYAKSMISSSVTDAVYEKIMHKESAYEAWEALKQQFEASSKDQLFKICTEFFAFSWARGDDVSTHVAKLKSLWNELNIGLKARNENALPDLLLVCKTLQILPSDFDNFQSSWMLLSKDESKTFDELISQLCMYERNFRKIADTEKVTDEALLAKTSFQKKKNSTCNYCKKKGHWVKTCKKWIADGRPPKNKAQADPQSNALDTDVALVGISEDIGATGRNSTGWWIDNGATKHVTNCPDLFIEFEKFQSPCTIKAAGKEALQAVGRGTIEILSFTREKTLKMILKDVWFVPKISKNLFSVLAAQDRNNNSQFGSTATKCWLEVNGSTVLCGNREVCGTLYKAAIEPVIPEKEERINVAEADTSTLQLYHERWGHQDKRHVRELLKRELGVNVKMVRDICEPCIFGKAHRLPFGTRVKATKPGELVSTDVVGPFCESFSKKRFLVVFKDSYTKFRYGFVIKHKSDVKVMLKQFLAHAKTLGHSIEELLSDNGGEFDCEEVKGILAENGITQRLTAPYTPEQNGGSERENRTIVEMARTFKYSNPEIVFPNAIWAELVTSAIYILNRTGKSSADGVSPYELWMNKKPRLKHLRIIGSSCYAHIPVEKRKKMDKKAVRGFLVGYDQDERYRIYVQEEHKVILSRDVQFQEKPKECEEEIKLPMRDVENDGEDYIEERRSSSLKTKQTCGSEEDLSSEEEYETGNESDSEEEENSKLTTERKLRDRSTISKPKQLKDYVFTVEQFANITEDPETFEDALQSEDKNEWKKAMDQEIASLNENQTWVMSELPTGAKAIPCKWVFRLKKNPDGTINKYKARLVVKGFSQRHGIDYSETFSSECKPISTPILKNSETLGPGKDDHKSEKFPYRQAVGNLMYLMLGSRPDLAYSVGFVSRSLENPSSEDIVRVKRIFRYIAGTLDLGLVYQRNKEKGILEVYSDADFGGCLRTGRSTSGVIVKYAGGAISWLSQRQTGVASSTTEAEIIAASKAAKEAIWLSRLFRAIVKLKHVPIVQVDNNAAVRLAQNPEFHSRTKHIAMKHFFIRDKISKGRLGIERVSTDQNTADIMTKPLPRTRLKILCIKMGLS